MPNSVFIVWIIFLNLPKFVSFQEPQNWGEPPAGVHAGLLYEPQGELSGEDAACPTQKP